MTLHLTDPHIAAAGRETTAHPRPAADTTPSHHCDPLCESYCTDYRDAWQGPTPAMPWDATGDNPTPLAHPVGDPIHPDGASA